MLRYFRSVNSLATWKAGKEGQKVLSQDHEARYTKDLIEGKGYPSIWLSETDEDLEKISLGILLRKGHLDNVNLVGFDEICFVEANAEVNHKEAVNFPVPTVSHLHYEIVTSEEKSLKVLIESFIQCNGTFSCFFRANPKSINMRQIAAKYLDEVSEPYKEMAKKWAQPSSQ